MRTIFKGNNATYAGGAIKFDAQELKFDKSTVNFINNLAEYGSNVASYPIALERTDDFTIEKLQLFTRPDQDPNN